MGIRSNITNAVRRVLGFGEKFCFAVKITPDVPNEIKVSPSFITPIPHAAAALSPAPDDSQQD